MDKSECKAIVDRNIKEMMRMLGVQNWRVNVEYEPCSDPNWVASCDLTVAYQRATITIDPSRAEDEADVIDSLRHELIHVLLSSFDIYRDMVTCSTEKDASMDAVENRAWRLAIENSVLAVERIFDLGMTGNPFNKLLSGNNPTDTNQP